MRLNRNLIAIINALALSIALCGCGASTSLSLDDDVLGIDELDELEGALGLVYKDNYDGMLGYGYNYLDSGEWDEKSLLTSAKILNTDNLVASGLIRYQEVYELSNNYVSGENHSEFYEKAVKTFGFDSASEAGTAIDYVMDMGDVGFTNVTEDTTGNSDYYFEPGHFWLYSSSSLRTERQLINAGKRTLSGFITDEFKEDIEKLSGANILRKYGCMVLTDLLLGGRYEVFCDMESTPDYSIDMVQAEYNNYLASYGLEDEKRFEGVENGSSYSQMFFDFDEYQREHVKMYSAIIGGSADGINTSNIASTVNSLKKWQSSLKNKQNEKLVAVVNGINIWDIASYIDSAKAEEIKNAYLNKEYLISNELEQKDEVLEEENKLLEEQKEEEPTEETIEEPVEETPTEEQPIEEVIETPIEEGPVSEEASPEMQE